jgi:riboflavin kinase/FMN adenylyltransferase
LEHIATIGFFDGVHKGHRFLFEHLRSEADKRGLKPLIITFDEHPRAALQTDYVPQLLTTVEERKSLLTAFGEVVIMPFAEIQPLKATEFMQRLKTDYGVSVLLMGYDHRFGSDRLKHPQDYRRVGAQCGIEVLTMSEYVDGELHVSSSEIRLALENGNIVVANELLGRPYALRGQVVHGKGLGRTIGFPTANIEPQSPHKIIPKAGVYTALVNTPMRDDAPAFVNIDRSGLIEVYVPSFKGDLYGQLLNIRFTRFIREEKTFSCLEELRQQIKADVDSTLRQDA